VIKRNTFEYENEIRD